VDSLRGQLLIAGPSLFDHNFRRTVLLVGEHNGEGALGVVLNRPADVSVEDVIPALGPLVPPGERLFFGGPVQPQGAVVLAELEHPELADILVFGSIGFLTGEVEAAMANAAKRARVFAGHAGWGPGQLEAEMEEESWILEPASADDVFAEEPDAMWTSVLRRKGGQYRLLSTMPFDPSLN
jgi:putative transcriptional regulator